MLKKVIIGIICFIFLIIGGIGIYIYTLDWNQHKALVSERLTQITGLKSLIEGNLTVDLFPQPKVTAGRVKFFSHKDGRTPLVVVNELSANLELSPLLDNKFIIQSMTLEQPSLNLILSENGEFNWKDVGKNSRSRSGNVEVSFNNIRLNNATVIFSNLMSQQEYNLPNISATISAPSLQGPYTANGHFIHNSSEIIFKGTVSQNNTLAINMSVDNAATGSKFFIDGTLDENAKGTVRFDTGSLTDVSSIIFGANSLNDSYRKPLSFSFQYDYNAGLANLEHFTLEYGKLTAGSGNILLNLKNEKNIAAEFNMKNFDLDILETLIHDYVLNVQKGETDTASMLSPYNISFKLRSPEAVYKGALAQNLNLGFNYNKGIVDISSFSLVMPGKTNLLTVGKLNLNKGLQYIFNQVISSEDFKVFASIFDVDLTKLATEENKKAIFKKASAELQVKGDLDNLLIHSPKATIDASTFDFNLLLNKNKDKTVINLDMATNKVLFDKYLQAIPSKLADSSYKDKFIYQLKLIPWNNDIDVDAKISIENAVYNKIPMSKVTLDFSKSKDTINLKSLSFDNLGGGKLKLAGGISQVFTNPQFKEFSYQVQTSNFPLFASSLGISTGDKELFNRKLFATQGALSGNFNDFNLSSVQKFGDTEFSYTGLVSSPANGRTVVSGDLEIKTNNFTNFVKSLNIDYSPNIPVTTFTSSGKIKGNIDTFEYSNINAYLGANNIAGTIQFDDSATKPRLKASLNFDKFDADHWFNLPKKVERKYLSDTSDFAMLPEFSDKQIDYSALKKVDFDVAASAKSLVYEGKTYLATKANMKLINGKLQVSSFDTKLDNSSINFGFTLDATSIPTINGKYTVKDIKTPVIGGKLYRLSSSLLTANGMFNSSAQSIKDFYEQLNANGSFELIEPTMYGWDLDVVKFELEQRKTPNGLEDFVRNNLRTGKSSFNKISGQYTINKGIVVADKILWNSPVVDMFMQLNLNLSDSLFNAVYSVIFHNASFSDVSRFTLEGKLANPTLKLDLSEPLYRIGESEKQTQEALKLQESVKTEKLKHKIEALSKSLEDTANDIAKLSQDVTQFAPRSKDMNVRKTYDDNIKKLADIEKKVTEFQNKVQTSVDEKDLMDMDAELKIEISKLRFIPKALEDNFIVDGKYVYDETFNKITWVYNVASNNNAYFKGLAEAYIKQLNLVKNSEKPLSAVAEQELMNSIQTVAQDMDKISTLHSQMRDDYLFIVDAGNIDVMKDNNDIAEQALKTILTYTKTLNKDIISSVNAFSDAFELTNRDYDDYMVELPDDINDINPSLSTVGTPKPKKQVEKPAEVVPQVTEEITIDETPADNVSPAQEETEVVKDVSEQQSEKQDSSEEVAPELVETLSDIPEPEPEQVSQDTETQPQQPLVEADADVMEKKTEKNEALDFQNGLDELVNTYKETKTIVTKKIITTSIVKTSHSPILSQTDSPIIPVIEDKKEVLTVALNDNKGLTSPAIKKGQEIINVSLNDNEDDIASSVIEEKKEIVNTSLDESCSALEKMVDMAKLEISGLSNLLNIGKTSDTNEIASLNLEINPNASSDDVATDDTQMNFDDVATPEEFDIVDYTFDTVEPATNLKRNPVIALEIGKDLSFEKKTDTSRFNKKSGFKAKKARFDDVVNSFTEQTETKLANADMPNMKQKDATTIDVIQTNIKNSGSLAQPNYSEKSFDDDATDFIEQQKSFNSRTIYVKQRNGGALPEVSGFSGKRMLKTKMAPTQTTTYENKYVFASNGRFRTPFNGQLGKSFSLYVE